MRVGVLRIYFRIHDSRSLKEKRMVMRSLKDRLASRFNISVAEVGSNDKWQAGELGIATVGNDGRFVSSVVEKVKQFLFLDPRISVMESDDGNACMVNDRILREGDEIEGFLVKRIGSDFIDLLWQDDSGSGAAGSKTEDLTIHLKLSQ